MPKPPRTLKTSTPIIASHTHTCSREHAWTCQWSNKCSLETLPSAQMIIDEMCPYCHNLQYGSYGS